MVWSRILSAMNLKKIFCCLLVLCITSKGFAYPREYLSEKIDERNRRYKTFLIALELCEKRNCRVLVETGTARHGDTNFEGDGGSTLIFGSWAKDHDAKLYTVDIDSMAIEQAQLAATEVADAIQFIHSDSVQFLNHFEGKIDFLYLDSFDFKKNNPLPSQLHHLSEIQAAFPHLHKRSVVMIDDCDLPHGGKGKFVIEYLKERGWTVLISDYQVIMVWKKS